MKCAWIWRACLHDLHDSNREMGHLCFISTSEVVSHSNAHFKFQACMAKTAYDPPLTCVHTLTNSSVNFLPWEA